jgi:tripeptide aminopeptidase
MSLGNPTLSLFLELAAIPSPPGEERAVADVVLRYLHDLGLEADEDGCGPEIGSTMGNIYARLDPTAEGTPLFFCAHLDTVPPSGPLEPVVEDGVVRNAGGTILGADNKSAVVAMLEGARRVLAENLPHAGIELLFTPKEEVGLVGAYAFDHDRLHARLGYVYDQAAPIGEIILGAPWAQGMQVRYHGRASHSGMFPEEGRSAIQAAARAIADLRLGRVDEETTANVGVISGGTAGNIVPEWCEFLAEARSQDERKLSSFVQEMLDGFTFAATAADCEVDWELRKSYTGYRFKESEDVVRLAASALERSGFTVSYALSGGAADANAFNERGRRCVNLANGMTDIHTADERIPVADLDAMVEVTVALVGAARAG